MLEEACFANRLFMGLLGSCICCISAFSLLVSQGDGGALGACMADGSLRSGMESQRLFPMPTQPALVTQGVSSTL